MKISRTTALVAIALFVLSTAACSSDDSSSSNASAAGPFASLDGKFAVGPIPQFSNCEGAVYFPQEVWVVVPVGSVVNVVPVPMPGTSPQPVSAAGPADAAVPDDAQAGQDGGNSQSPSPQPSPQDTPPVDQAATPPPFSATMDSSMQFQASQLAVSTTPNGCLQRTTTMMDVQFTADGKLSGTRSVFNEYAGGTDCPADCRMVFSVAGAKIPE